MAINIPTVLQQKLKQGVDALDRQADMMDKARWSADFLGGSASSRSLRDLRFILCGSHRYQSRIFLRPFLIDS
jgi:hypothetical protein